MSYIHSALQSRVSSSPLYDLSPVDELLNQHTHGILFPFHTDTWNPTHNTATYPSRKIKNFARGTFTTGTTDNWGYVAAGPQASSNGGTIISSNVGGAVAYNGFANPTTVTTNSPFTNANFSGAANQARNNVCGLRCRNVTPMLNRAGTCYALRSPNDESLTGAFGGQISNLDMVGCSKRCDTSGSQWNYTYWTPRDDDQYEYGPAATTLSPAGSAINYIIAFVVEAPAGTPQTYEFEYVCWSEVIINAGSTPTNHGTTVNDPHIHTGKVQQIVSALHLRPEVSQREPSHYLSNFVTRAVLEGHRIADIINKGCDIASRTASVGSDVMNVGRQILKAVV